MVDGDLRNLCWSVAIYYLALVLALFVTFVFSPDPSPVGEALGAAAGAPLLAVFMFFTGLYVINVWVASAVVIAVLGGLAAAIARLRGKLRIVAVLAILTVMNLYAFYIGARVGA